MNDNFARLVALMIMGGVAKSLFGPPRIVYTPNDTPESVTTLRDVSKPDN